jgi:hypothetical protein
MYFLPMWSMDKTYFSALFYISVCVVVSIFQFIRRPVYTASQFEGSVGALSLKSLNIGHSFWVRSLSDLAFCFPSECCFNRDGPAKTRLRIRVS